MRGAGWVPPVWNTYQETGVGAAQRLMITVEKATKKKVMGRFLVLKVLTKPISIGV